MGTDTIEQAEAAGRARREQAVSGRADKATRKLNKGEDEVKAADMVGIWNAAATNMTEGIAYHCPPLSQKDAGLIKGKLNRLLEERPDESYSAGQFLLQYCEWIIDQWNSMRARHGTGWMADKDMLPRHPEMTFVVHHWKFFLRAYADRHLEKGHNYVSPEVDELREEVGRLKRQLLDARRFSRQARLDNLKEENAKLTALIEKLSTKIPVDLDTDLPEWEEEPND